jgi:nucleotide-binding universal stress UspA family protein
MTQPDPTTQPRLATIVVGVDGSPESLYALDLAATIGRAQEATIHIVHVRPRLRTFGLGAAGSVEYAQAEDELDRAVRDEAGAHLSGHPGTWTVTIRSGNVGHELLSVADELDADLVVVGHRSHGTLHDALLGSTATGTVHHSRRSVLVAIPPSAAAPAA